MRRIIVISFALLLAAGASVDTDAAEYVLTKHIIDAPAPYGEPAGAVTPDGTFNVRDPNAPFHSDVLADSLMLDSEGRDSKGGHLNLNHAVYTVYRLADDRGKPDTILVLMPGTWAGAISMDTFARHLLAQAAADGRKGLQVWLHDRRSEQMEDHVGLWWAEENLGRLPVEELLQGINDYYRPGYDPEADALELMGRRLTPLDHDAVRFMGNWGADVAVRDWREVVLAANRAVGNDVSAPEGEDLPRVTKKPGRRVFIGGHSLGGSLTVLYAGYDFDRRPGREVIGAEDIDGLVLLEGGGLGRKEPGTIKADKYLRSLEDYYKDAKVYFDLDVMGIRYSPPTMASAGIAGWASTNAPGQECIFPMESRPEIVRLPHATNEAVLGLAMDDDTMAFFIARVSIGFPSGETGIGGQLRRKTAIVPVDPGECRPVTPWLPGHRPMDPDYVYDWVNIDEARHPDADKPLRRKCKNDDPEVTDFYVYAKSLYAGPPEYEEMPWLSRGPNDFLEWYFPVRLTMDSRYSGKEIVEADGTELFNGSHVNEISLPVISFTGDDSMGEYVTPELTEERFTKGALEHAATQVHLIRGYTHLDITVATRNFQPDLQGGHEGFNAPAVYSYRFIEEVCGGR